MSKLIFLYILILLKWANQLCYGLQHVMDAFSFLFMYILICHYDKVLVILTWILLLALLSAVEETFIRVLHERVYTIRLRQRQNQMNIIQELANPYIEEDSGIADC